jgi:hypothetical protein
MPLTLDTAEPTFHPVIQLPAEYEVYDFTQGYDPDRTLSHPYGIGRYDEHRPGMYEGEQFEGIRNIHMGIDIGCPAGEPVYAFSAGTIHKLGDNAIPYDYGPTLITQHQIGETSSTRCMATSVAHAWTDGQRETALSLGRSWPTWARNTKTEAGTRIYTSSSRA